MVISGVPATFPSGRKEALKEKLEQSKVFGESNEEKEKIQEKIQQRKNLPFLEDGQHLEDLVGDFWKFVESNSLENEGISESVCSNIFSSHLFIPDGKVANNNHLKWGSLSGFSTGMCPKYILLKETDIIL